MPETSEYAAITQDPNKSAQWSFPRRLAVSMLSVCMLGILMLAEKMDTTNTYYHPMRRAEGVRACPYVRGLPSKNASNSSIADEVQYVIYIPSPIEWHGRREHVLRKMRSELRGDTHLYFVFGTRAGPLLERETELLDSGRAEAALETDVRVRYLFTNCRDNGDEVNNPNGTSSTTCKTYEALRYVARAYAASPPLFVWRGADDAYLDLHVFRTLVVPKLQTCRLFLGQLQFPQPWNREDLDLSVHQPRLYGLFGVKKLAKYMYGMGFCMSWDVVRFLGLGTIPPHLTFPEDVIVSQWLVYYDVDWKDIGDVDPGVGMYSVDHDFLKYIPQWPRALLVAHKLNDAQWDALQERPDGNVSYAFATVK